MSVQKQPTATSVFDLPYIVGAIATLSVPINTEQHSVTYLRDNSVMWNLPEPLPLQALAFCHGEKEFK